MPSVYLPLHHPPRVFPSRSAKPAPLIVILAVAPFLTVLIITADLRFHPASTAPLSIHTYDSHLQLQPRLLPVRSRTFHAIGLPIHKPPDVPLPPVDDPIPENGFPPPTLHSIHPNFHLLNQIRNLSQLTPRWPKHPHLHASALRTYGPAYSSIIISDKLKVIYVPVFKVGTTSMMWHIAYLENNPHVLDKTPGKPGALDLVLHQMSSPAWKNHTIYKRSADEIRRVFEDPSYLKFGFVRNPFDRIISAYLDKIASWPIESDEYQKQMWSLYGNNLARRAEANVSKPSFRKFVYDIAEVLRMPRTPTDDLSDSNAYEDNSSRRDMHWRPQVELLHPDLIPLDFVGRFEKIMPDRQVVLEWMYRHTDRRMPIEEEEKLHATDPRDKVELYDRLRHDEALRRLVVNTYRQDFQTFQFSINVPNDK